MRLETDLARPRPGPLGAEAARVVGDPLPAPTADPFPGAPGRPDNAGRAVFRVRARRPGLALGTFVFGGGILAFVLSRLHPSAACRDPWGLSGDFLVGFGVALLFATWFLQVHECCSDPDCRASLRGVEGSCPRCGGTIRGTIRREQDRLAAEEALREETSDAGGEGAG